MTAEYYYKRLKEIMRSCVSWIGIESDTKGGDKMYKSLHFESLIHLKDFLNKSDITPDRIIGIYPFPVALGVIDYEILFISNETHITKEN